MRVSLQVDTCCRDHDMCEYYIDARSEKYNYNNRDYTTLMHCDCDDQ